MDILAVDGGQSAIRARHSSGGPTVTVEGVSRQEGDVLGAVADAITTAWRRMGGPPTDRAVLGLTTAPTEPELQVRLCAAVAQGTGAPEVWLADDAVTTHAGALSLGWGVSVAAGTGVACLVVPADPARPPRIIGGHGYLLGDEGGAFWIGRAGIAAALRADEGRGAPTALAGAVADAFGGLEGLADRLHAADRPVNRIAHFAPRVLALADAGDPVAETIAAAAACELAQLIAAAVVAAGAADGAGADGGHATEPQAADGIPVALAGRLLAPGSSLRRRLSGVTGAVAPSARMRDADASALDGALRLGLAADPGRYAPLMHRWRIAA